MATQIEAGPGVKRADMFIVDPFEIDVQEALRGRYKPPTEEDVIDLALSIIQGGQRQPVESRKTVGNRLILVMGFTRMAAIRLICEGFEYEGTRYHDPNFRIKTLVVICDESEAVKRNVVENRHRLETSPMDDAFNMGRLEDRYGYSDAEIATLYRLSVAQVQRLKQLVRLPEEMRDKVHTRVLSVDSALTLEQVPEPKRAAIVEAATTTNGKISGAEVKKQVRDHILSDDSKPKQGEVKSPKPPKLIRRSLKDVYERFQVYGREDNDRAAFAKIVLEYIDGKTTDTQLLEAWENL